MDGLENPIGVTLDMMIMHGQAVMRTAKQALVVVDLPFGSFEESPEVAYRSAARVMKEVGCQAVKVEASEDVADSIRYIVERGIPVMGHIGLRPQAINLDGGMAVRSNRTQFIKRMVHFAQMSGLSIHLIYYPPYHSKYNPIERCWGILELKWNGTKLTDAETMVEWAKRMTWRGLHPVVELSRQVYQKGIRLGKAAMEAVEARLKRDPKLPKYDILINPASIT